MHPRIRETGPEEYYLVIPQQAVNDSRLWHKATAEVRNVFQPEVTVYIDLQHIHELPSSVFNLLYNLAIEANRALSTVLYVNVNNELEERMALLTTRE